MTEPCREWRGAHQAGGTLQHGRMVHSRGRKVKILRREADVKKVVCYL